jgi:hypothetical protein
LIHNKQQSAPGRDCEQAEAGGPEMLVFNLTTLHLWDRVPAKFHEARVIAYTDDGYIKAKLIVVL